MNLCLWTCHVCLVGPMVDHEPCIDSSLYIVALNLSACAQTYKCKYIYTNELDTASLRQRIWAKSLSFIFPPKHVIPKSLKVSHWLSEQPKSEHHSKKSKQSVLHRCHSRNLANNGSSRSHLLIRTHTLSCASKTRPRWPFLDQRTPWRTSQAIPRWLLWKESLHLAKAQGSVPRACWKTPRFCKFRAWTCRHFT